MFSVLSRILLIKILIVVFLLPSCNNDKREEQVNSNLIAKVSLKANSNLENEFSNKIDIEEDEEEVDLELFESDEIENETKQLETKVKEIRKAVKTKISRKTVKPEKKIVKKVESKISYRRRKEVVVKKSVLPALADLKGSLESLREIKSKILANEAEEIAAKKIRQIVLNTKLPQKTKAEKAKEIKRKVVAKKVIKKVKIKPVKKVLEVVKPKTKTTKKSTVLKRKVSSKIQIVSILDQIKLKVITAHKKAQAEKKALEQLEDNELLAKLMDEDEDLEPDYKFANSSISGFGSEYDKMARRKLYGHAIVKVAKRSPIIKTAAKKKIRVALNIPAKKEKKFEINDTNNKATVKNDLLIAKLNGTARAASPKRDIINAKSIIDTIINEKERTSSDELNKKIGEELKPLEKRAKNGKIGAPKSIISSGKIREALKHNIDVATESVDHVEPVKPSESNASKTSIDAPSHQSKLLASSANTPLPRSRKKFSISGEIKLPKTGGEYPKGYGYIYNHIALNGAGYPAGYSEGVKLHKFEIRKNGRTNYLINNIKEGTKLNLVAEFFSSKEEHYEKMNPKDFFGVTNKKNRSVLIDTNINDINFTFPRLEKSQKTRVVGQTGKVVVPFSTKKDSLSDKQKSFEHGLAEVRVVGTGKNAFTEKDGTFKFASLPSSSGLSFEVFGRGLYPAVFSTCKRENLTFPLFTNDEVKKINKVANENGVLQAEDRGIIIGKIRSGSEGEDGIVADLSELDADGPFYFNEKNEIDFTLKNTSSNGMFAYFNVPEGLQIVGPRRGKEELSGGVVDVYAETVSFIDIDVDDAISFKVVVRNAIPAEGASDKVSNAKVTIIGAPGKSFKTDSKGVANIKDVRAIKNINTIEVEKEGYEISRVTGCFDKKIEIFVFPRDRMDEIKQDLRNINVNYNPKLGMAMGSIMRGGELSIDVPEADNATIIYFDSKGNPRTDLEGTSKIDGNFIILNLPVGQRNVVAYDKKGEIKNYFTIRSGGSIVNSIIAR